MIKLPEAAYCPQKAGIKAFSNKGAIHNSQYDKRQSGNGSDQKERLGVHGQDRAKQDMQ